MKRISINAFQIGLLSILLLLSSCIDENPLLVNPPPKSETVKVRFMNLSSDKNIKTLSMDSISELSGVAYGTISESIKPPSDSVSLIIKSGNVQEFKYSQLIRFIRNTNYTFVGLSSMNCKTQNCGIDTIIILRTTIAIDPNTTNAYVKFFNAYPDSTASYSLHLGCPNGDMLASGTRYLGYSIQPFFVPSGKTAVSIVKSTPTGDQLVNLYQLDLAPQGQYSIIVSKNPVGNEEALLLDENDQTITALNPITVINDRTTSIRLINLSQYNATSNTSSGSEIASEQSPSTIGKYAKVSACGGNTSDTLNLFSGGVFKHSVPTQLVVLEKYSFIAFDSTGNDDLKGIFVKPISKEILQSGKAYVRVVHASLSAGALTVSLGARYKPQSPSDASLYESGKVLASPVNFGEISTPTVLNPGQLPITVFTASGAARLKFAGLAEIEADKSYLMVIVDGANGELEISLIEDEAENQSIQYVRRGAFVQVVNAIPNDTYSRISASTNFGMLLNDARVYYTGSFGTVMEEGDNSILINDFKYSFNCPVDKSIMVVASGDYNSPDIFSNIIDPFSSNNTFRLRFANAASDINLLNIRQNDTTGDIAESAYYKGFSSFQQFSLTSKITYYFFKDEGNVNLYRLSDQSPSIGDSYTIIFSGSKNYGYATIIQQDF